MEKELKYRRKRCKSKRQPKKSKGPSMERKRCERCKRCHGMKSEVKRFVPPKEPVKKPPKKEKKMLMGPPPPPGPRPQPERWIGSAFKEPLFHPMSFNICHVAVASAAWHYKMYYSTGSQHTKKQ